MKPFLLSVALAAAASASSALKADESARVTDQSAVPAADQSAPAPESKESMRARMLQDAKRKAAEAAKAPAAPAPEPTKLDKDSLLPPPAAAASPASPPSAVEAAAPSPRLPAGESESAAASPSPDKPAVKQPAASPANAQAAAQPAAMLPKVEVQKTRITVLDQQLSEQQKQIAREEKLTKPTELDKALNGAGISKKLSALGGQSADYRAGNAAERVSIMKEEADLLEAIAHTKDKKEKAELQSELDELRAYRRELEKTQR